MFGGKYFAKELYRFEKNFSKSKKEEALKLEGGATVSAGISSIADVSGGVNAGKKKEKKGAEEIDRTGYSINRYY